MQLNADSPESRTSLVGAIRESPLQTPSLQNQGIRRLEWAALVGILLLAAALRLGWPGVNSFAFDEANLSLIALEMARGGTFASVGMPSSVGVPNLPAAAWVFSLPYVVSPDPLIATQFVGLLSIGVVAGTWWLARRIWGGWAGLTAALFLAASPYAVLYSRSIWSQNLLPLCGLLWAWTAYLGATRHNRLAIAAHVFLAGFIFQVHFAGAALVLPTLYFFVRFRWWRHLLPVLIGGGLALLALLPFALEVACCRPDVVEQYQAALGGDTRYDLQAFGHLLQVALGTDWGFLLLGNLQPPDSPLVAALAGVALLTGLIAIIVRIIRPRRRTGPDRHAHRPEHAILAEILIAWLIAAPLFFARHSTPVQIHYQLAALPALALLVGAGVRFLQSRTRLWRILPLLVAVLTGVWTVQLAQGLDLAERVVTPNGLGTPLSYTRIAAHSAPPDQPALFFTHGDDPNVDGEAAVFETLWWGRPHRIVRGGSLLILPDHPAYLMATLYPIQAWEELDAAGLAENTRILPRRDGEEPFVATVYDGAAAPQGFTLLDEPVALADGTQLEGWRVRTVGPRLRISTLWRVNSLPEAGTYQQFHHLRTSDAPDDAEPFKITDVPLSAHRWQVDDQLIVMADFFMDELAAIEGSLWVDVGHYTLPDGARIPQVNNGTDALRLGPFELPTTE